MEIKIEWSQLSERQLKNIFDYYSNEVSIPVVRKIISKIVNKISILKKSPLIGAKE